MENIDSDDTLSICSSTSSLTNESINESTNHNFIDNMSFEDAQELEHAVYEAIDEYTKEHIGKMCSSNFHTNLVQDIAIQFFELLDDFDECSGQDHDYEFIEEFVKLRAEIFFDTISDIPNRSCKERFVQGTVGSRKGRFVQGTVGSCKQIADLRALPQPVQRTKEWYEFRYNLITASSLGKLFSSESQYNSIICEKCKPLDYASSLGNCSVDSPMHWGTKYEPLTIMLYEKMYQTKIEDFGCIKHRTYPCIGASPDGINVDPNSPLYGRMLEVKNIVNREISGIPLDAYWIQMQGQMETCDLDECDFIETQFKEYSDVEFYSDSIHTEHGVVLYFVKKSAKVFTSNAGYNVPHYVFMPLTVQLNKESVDQWIAQKKEELRDTYTLYTTQYWYLEKMSCVLVQRNRAWFNASVSKIVDAWAIIEKERVSGWEHRLPKKYRDTGIQETYGLSPKATTGCPTGILALYASRKRTLPLYPANTNTPFIPNEHEPSLSHNLLMNKSNNFCVVKVE
jgi:hypothetical protein